jgi:hypothetical protein
MAKWKSRHGIPVSAHPHAMGLNPAKDVAAAGGPGYKLVSHDPFKRYGFEDAKHPLRSETVQSIRAILHSDNPNAVFAAAKELRRRWKNGRQIPLTVGDWKIIHQHFPSKPKPQRKKGRRIF